MLSAPLYLTDTSELNEKTASPTADSSDKMRRVQVTSSFTMKAHASSDPVAHQRIRKACLDRPLHFSRAALRCREGLLGLPLTYRGPGPTAQLA